MKIKSALASMCAVAIGSVMLPNAVLADDAVSTKSQVLINGNNVAFEAYNIGGNNYFKLRDLAYSLNGTDKQFEVGYDGAANVVSLISGQSYSVVGGEMNSTFNGNITATPTNSKIMKDGVELQLTTYNINGNNYFKLRDIGKIFNFGIEWDSNANTISVNTNEPYVEEQSVQVVDYDFTNGFELAEFSKFNSFASDNGLGGTPIYFVATLDTVEIFETGTQSDVIVGYLTDVDGHKWLAILDSTILSSKSDYDRMVGKQLIVCGLYDGYSAKTNTPGIQLYKLKVIESGEIKTGVAKFLEEHGGNTTLPSSKNNSSNNSATQLPMYSYCAEVPDFGAIFGVNNVADEPISSGGTYYKNETTSAEIKEYLSILKSLGFSIAYGGDIISCKKDNIFVDIAFTESYILIVITK